MSYEHQKSVVTIFLDIIRNVLILIATGFLVFMIWKWHWVAAVLAAIPIYLIMMNLIGILTLPLYMLTPENRLMSKAHKAFKAGNFELGNALTNEFKAKFKVE